MEDKNTLVCRRCGYEWEPRVQNPVACPGCCSLCWNKPIPDAPVLSGGNLVFYLKNNRKEVLKHFRKHGLESTLKVYNVSQPTLLSLIRGDYGEANKLSTADRAIAMAEITVASNAILRRELREMRGEYEQLIENISKRVMVRLALAFRTGDSTITEGPGKERELAITE